MVVLLHGKNYWNLKIIKLIIQLNVIGGSECKQDSHDFILVSW
jgi:uncharacterized Rossmann fold enzyme